MKQAIYLIPAESITAAIASLDDKRREIIGHVVYAEDTGIFYTWNGTEYLSNEVDGTLVLLAELDYETLNGGAEEAEFILSTSEVIPAGKYITEFFIEYIDEFISETAEVAIIEGLTSTYNFFSFAPNGAIGIYSVFPEFPKQKKEEVTQDFVLSIGFTGGADNPIDFTAGLLRVYGLFKSFPVLPTVIV